ncbi:MAG TPA: hypothetical protein VGN12_23865 [Pirellulales bacterium]|jgi:hypothetical protein
MWSQVIETLASDPGIMLGALLGSLAMISGTAICMTAIISEAWRKVRQTEDNNALKQSMLDRGMSADEITAVVRAAPEKRARFSISAGRAGLHCQT